MATELMKVTSIAEFKLAVLQLLGTWVPIGKERADSIKACEQLPAGWQTGTLHVEEREDRGIVFADVLETGLHVALSVRRYPKLANASQGDKVRFLIDERGAVAKVD
jgi:hypothetical protein